jgi:hypothetical protein
VRISYKARGTKRRRRNEVAERLSTIKLVEKETTKHTQLIRVGRGAPGFL